MPIYELDGVRPNIHPQAWVAPGATVIGNVEIGAGASIWFGVVLRGDAAPIVIGPGANVQDNSVIHCSRSLPTVLEANVTVGHGALLEGCVVEEGALVGMGAIMLQRSRLGRGSVLAAGAVLGEGSEVPPGHLAAGVPAKVKKVLSGGALRWVDGPARTYQANAVRFRDGLVQLAD